MLSHNSTPEVAAMSRVRPRQGASLPSASPALHRARVFPMAARHPQAGSGAAVIGAMAQAAGQVTLGLQQRTTDTYAQMTRIAPTGGGALGPQKARDPV